MSKPSRRPGREEIKEPARKKRQKKDAPRLDLQPPHETLKSPRPLQSGGRVTAGVSKPDSWWKNIRGTPTNTSLPKTGMP